MIPEILLVQVVGGVMSCFILVRAWRFVRRMVWGGVP